jgi:hypothetical protein
MPFIIHSSVRWTCDFPSCDSGGQSPDCGEYFLFDFRVPSQVSRGDTVDIRGCFCAHHARMWIQNLKAFGFYTGI